MLILDTDGRWLARTPRPSLDFAGQLFDWREYFAGGARLGRVGKRGVHISRAYTSVADGTTRFALMTPVYGTNGRWLGLLQGAVGTATALGTVTPIDPDEPHRISTVVARRDRDKSSDPLPSDWLVLLHDGVTRSSRHQMDDRGALASLPAKPTGAPAATSTHALSDDNYRDPIAGFEGRWLAGVAPVGETPFAVIVQTRYEAAVAPNHRLAGRLRAAGAGALVVALLAYVVFLVSSRARRARG
jgi:hypothetical protein